MTAFENMEIADSHEHLLREAERLSRTVDFYTFAGFEDTVVAGMPPETQRMIDKADTPDAKRWRTFEAYSRFSRLSGHNEALGIIFRDIYGIENISFSELGRINAAICARNQPGFTRHILKERARIRFYVLDDRGDFPIKADGESFVTAREFERFIVPATPGDIQKLEQITGVSITSLRGLKQALERSFQQALDAGMAAVKTLLAYEREILFQEVEERDAARDFDSLMRGDQVLATDFHKRLVRPFRRLEDHMFHYMIQIADAHKIPVQVHTGLNYFFINHANPTHLTNLFFLYPRTKFDLFHISYPYMGELSTLAMSFPNVYIDFCWANSISPTVARRALDEFLETVPANKILGFGGDTDYAEFSYAHAKMARRDIAKVLACKTEAGSLTENEALDLGRMLLHDNAASLFLHRPHRSA